MDVMIVCAAANGKLASVAFPERKVMEQTPSEERDSAGPYSFMSMK